MKLNARQVETAKPKDKTYKMADGGGLYLEITAKGSKYWRMKYRRPNDKKEDRLAFGVWPTVTLAEARGKRDEAKRLLVQGVDPKAEQKEAQAETAGIYFRNHRPRMAYQQQALERGSSFASAPLSGTAYFPVYWRS